MGILMKQGLLSIAPLHSFRYVSYNQAAHSWLMYEASEQELYLIDATLPQGDNQFNLRTSEGLIAAIEAYNAIGLNGLLADVIKHYDLKNMISEEKYDQLFDVEYINPPVAEQFDEHMKFEFARSFLSGKVVSKPVRILLATSDGEEEVSDQIYDQAEIEAYIATIGSNIF
jgi:hypothetical protein